MKAARSLFIVVGVVAVVVGAVLVWGRLRGRESSRAVGAVSVAQEQQVQPENGSKPVNPGTEVITCRENPAASAGEVMASNSGARAFVEVKTSAVERQGDQGTCEVVWTLHVAAPGSEEFSPVVIHREKEEVNPEALGGDSARYYGARVLGWSEDGRSVLAQATVAAIEDWFKPVVAVYGMEERKLWTADLERMFAARVKKDCTLSFGVGELVSAAEVKVDVRPFEWVEDQNCFPESGGWVVDVRQGTAAPAR